MAPSNPARFLFRVAAVLAGCSAVLAVFALARVEALGKRVFLLICAGILLILACLPILLVLMARRVATREHNFFLYDRALRGNMPLEQLTAQHVSDCLVMYMSMFRRGRELYLASLFDAESGIPEAFKPLFCYQLLGMLSTSENDAQLAAFLSCGKELADVFSVYLGKAEEHELARDLQILIARFDGKEIGTLRAYLRNRSDYLSGRMLAYTKEHIREFD